MKFIIAVVMLALAVANASVLPLAYSSSYALPLAYTPGISLSQGYAGLSYAAPVAYNVPSAYNWAPHSLGSVAVAAPVASQYAAVAAPVALPAPAHSASYVATTRGAQHVAPLPGHVQSVASNNVQPAPGTW